MRKIPAFIDEKNVCTDWIVDVFDTTSDVECGRQALGFINDAPVYASWSNNCITWRCIDGNGDYDKVIKEIKTRLSEFEDSESDLFSECYIVGHSVIQNFYFRAG